jgi:hypothetical protein
MGTFDSEWRRTCSVRKCSIKDVDQFLDLHYLHKRPAVVLLAMVAERFGAAIGCIVYAAPPRESDKRYGGKTWELARLYLLDEVPKNAETWLIGRSVRYIRQNHPDVEVLVSYADPSVGHSGTIYKAANWRADGRTDEGRKTPRCDYQDARTGKKYGRRGNVPPGADLVRVPRVSKFRFVLDLRK